MEVDRDIILDGLLFSKYVVYFPTLFLSGHVGSVVPLDYEKKGIESAPVIVHILVHFNISRADGKFWQR